MLIREKNSGLFLSKGNPSRNFGPSVSYCFIFLCIIKLMQKNFFEREFIPQVLFFENCSPSYLQKIDKLVVIYIIFGQQR